LFENFSKDNSFYFCKMSDRLKSGFLKRLKEKWGLKNLWQVIIILIVFSCTGFSILFVERWILELIGVPKDLSIWLRILFFVIITLPVYQVLLLIYGFIFGQFKFFWEFEKRFFKRLLFLPKHKSKE
jgi:hypothetical protein